MFADGRISSTGASPARLLAVAPDTAAPTVADAAVATTQPVAGAEGATSSDATAASPEPRRHTVARGESAWKIAKRYGIGVAELMQRNGLAAKAVLRPGQAIDLAEIRRFLEQARLARQKFPEHLVAIDELPRVPSGKVSKDVLRARARQIAEQGGA